MKKLLFALCALAAISLLAPSAGFAQWQNRIGVYTDADASATVIGSPVQYAPFNIYFVLTNPRDAGGAPITAVKGFEFHVTIVSTATGFIRLTEILPPAAINVGNASNAFDAMYLVGLGTTIPVVGDKVTLMTWNVMITDITAPYHMFLGPATPPSAPGRLAFLLGSIIVPADPSSASATDAVFGVGPGAATPTPIESESFGAVKALFR